MSVCQRLTDVSHAHNSSEGKSHPLSDWLKGQSTFSVCTWQIWISCRDEISPGYSELSLPTETFPAELTWSAPMPSFCYTKHPKHRFIAQKAEGARIFQENLQKQGPQFLSFLRTEKFNGRGGESVFDPHFPNTSETNFTLHSLLSHPSALFPQPPDPWHSALLHATAPCSQGC